MHLEPSITLLTQDQFIDPKNPDWYIKQILLEDKLLTESLEALGFKVLRKSWDDSEFEWSSTDYILFRAIWDYFLRYDEFSPWFKRVQKLTHAINPLSIIDWNIDKAYLQELGKLGINIPPTQYIEPGDTRTLQEICNSTNWKDFVLKPAISGGGRHTYRFNQSDIEQYEEQYSGLIAKEAMILQEFQYNVPTKGEISFMVFGGTFSHAILKKAKSGDFRVQDDFGGTVHDYAPRRAEIEYAEALVSQIPYDPVYARVDAFWDNNDQLCLAELELIEPELWLRMHPQGASILAKAILDYHIKHVGSKL